MTETNSQKQNIGKLCKIYEILRKFQEYKKYRGIPKNIGNIWVARHLAHTNSSYPHKQFTKQAHIPHSVSMVMLHTRTYQHIHIHP